MRTDFISVSRVHLNSSVLYIAVVILVSLSRESQPELQAEEKQSALLAQIVLILVAIFKKVYYGDLLCLRLFS